MAYCGEHTAVKSEGKRALTITLRCKSWLCPECTDGRKRRLIAEAIGGNPTTFLTLTSRRRDDMTCEEAAKRLSYAWRLTRLRLIRHYKLKSLPFLAVVERTRAGWPHLHILLRGPWLSQKFISQCMKELCDGPIVWIEKIDRQKKVANYCAKYCGKCVQKIGTTKRYWRSYDYDLRDNEEEKKKYAPGQGWELWQKNVFYMADCFKVWGYTIDWIGSDRFVASLSETGPP